MRNIRLAPTLLVLLLSLTTGCTKKPTDDPTTLYVGLSAGPATLDPRKATDAVGMRIASLLFSSIVRLGPELDIVGEAASEWTYKDLTYTFKLRPGLKFVGRETPAEGLPVTANDIEFSLAEYKSEKSPFASALEPIESFKTEYGPTGGTLVLKLKRFSATLLTDLAPVKILPAAIVKAKGDDFRDWLVGSGSFSLVSADTNEIRLKANPFNPYAKPKMENVVFKIVREDNTRYLKILKGELDIAQQELPPTKVTEIEKKGGFQIFKYPGLSMSYVLVNLRDASLKSKELRQGLSYAINRDEIIRFKLEGLAQPATSILSPINPFHDGTLIPPKFDLEKAKALIEAAGLKGKELTLKTSNATQAVENARVIANQLEAAGLKIKLQSFEWGTFYDDVKKGNFQLATMKWVGTTDPDIYKSAFHSAEVPPKGRNRGLYINATLDRLVDQGREIENIGRRRDHYRKIQKIVYDDLPIIPLWYEYEVAVLSAKITGYAPSKNGDYSALTKVEKH